MKIKTTGMRTWIAMILFLSSQMMFSQGVPFSLVNNNGDVQYTSNLASNYMHFYLFDDGYYARDKNPQHDFKTNTNGYNSGLHFIDTYDEDEPDLFVVNTGAVNSSTANNPPISIKGVVDLQESWSPTNYGRSFILLQFQNKTSASQSGCLDFYFNANEIDVFFANIMVYNNWVTLQNVMFDQISWSFSDLLPGEQRIIYIPIRGKQPVGGTINCSTNLKVNCIGPGVWSQYTSSVSQWPHDPNYKKPITEKLSYTGELISQTGQESQVIKYEVQFVNDGSGVANEVKVVDYLEDGMDAYSVKVTKSKFPVSVNVLNANQVEFNFSDIDLPGLGMPGVTANEATGKFHFEVCYNGWIDSGDCVGNMVDIYFDQQAPIRAISDLVCCPEPSYFGNVCRRSRTIRSEYDIQESIGENIIIYPNPASNALNISYDKTYEFEDVVVVNTFGETILTVEPRQTIKNEETISLDGLKSGLYFIKFVSKEQTIVKPFTKI